MDGMIVMLVWLAGMIVHVSHQEEMRQRAKQYQPHNNHSTEGNLQEKDGCQPQNGKQTAKQHDPDMTFIHMNLPSFIPPVCKAGG
jgi:hypothetical protein